MLLLFVFFFFRISNKRFSSHTVPQSNSKKKGNCAHTHTKRHSNRFFFSFFENFLSFWFFLVNLEGERENGFERNRRKTDTEFGSMEDDVCEENDEKRKMKGSAIPTKNCVFVLYFFWFFFFVRFFNFYVNFQIIFSFFFLFFKFFVYFLSLRFTYFDVLRFCVL